MSLLLDALQRASKDKEKAALAAAQAAAADSMNEGKVVLTAPTAMAIDFPDLVPTPSPLAEAEASVPLALSLTPDVMETTALVPVAMIAAKPSELALEMELDASAAVMQPKETVIENPPEKTEPSSVNVFTATAKPEDATPNRRGDVGPKPAHPKAAAAAIQNAYAAPKFAPKPPQNRRAVVLAGIAGLLGLAFATFMLGVWGDPEKLLGLGGNSSIAPVTPPPTAGPPPIQEAASAPTSTMPPEATNQIVASPTAAPTPPLPSRVAASAPSAAAVPASVATSKKVTVAPDEVVLRASGASPVFAARVRSQSVLEQGYAALLAGRLDDASRSYTLALESNPGEPDALLGLAYIAHTRGQRDEAQSYYRKVLRQDPSNNVASAGLVALDPGANGAPSSERAKELAARQPDSAAVQALAAAALAQEGALPDAALAFARAQALEPGNPLYAYNLAVALDKLGNYVQAASQYDRALRVSASAARPLAANQMQAARARASQLRQSLGMPHEVAP